MRETVGGFHPIYLDSVYNTVMIEVGRELSVTVVDARPLLEPEMFIDMCHPDEIGQTRIAKLVLEAVKSVAPALSKDAGDIVRTASQPELGLAPVPEPSLASQMR